MRITDRAFVQDFDVVPRGWGFCYRRWDYADSVFLPIPLNILVRVFLSIYWSLVGGLFRNRFEKAVEDVYDERRRGIFADGYIQGKKDGERVGWDDCMKHWDRVFNSYKKELSDKWGWDK